MRFVLKFTITDGCTFLCDETLPVEYASVETFLRDLKTVAEKHIETGGGEILYADNGVSVYAHHFVWNGKYYEPAVMSVDEWFNQCRNVG